MAAIRPSVVTSAVRLNDGRSIPAVGLGVWQAGKNGETFEAVKQALAHGYRHIDTAAIYGNEDEVGKAVKESGIPREQIWVTTKLWNSDQGYKSAKNALDTSLKKLGLDYVDLYLLHSPVQGRRLDSWRALEELQAEGKAKSIGVSNFGIHHLEELLAVAKVPPAVNQIELSPYLTREKLVKYCESKNIALEAYSPLTRGAKLKDPKLVAIAERYKKSTAQLLIKWSLQKGFITLPKSVTADRITANIELADFTISEDDMAKLDLFDEDLITGWDPTTSA